MGLPSAPKLVAFRRIEIPNSVASLREQSDRASDSGPEKGKYLSGSEEGYPGRKFRRSKRGFFLKFEAGRLAFLRIGFYRDRAG